MDNEINRQISPEEMPVPAEGVLTDPKKAAKRKKLRKILIWSIFILIAAGAIFYALYSDLSNSEADFKDVGKMVGSNWYFFLYALAAFCGYILFRAMTHAVMMRFLTKKIRPGVCLSVTVLGRYYDNITPFATGGQPFQIQYLKQKGIDEGPAITLPLAEYSISRFAFLFLSITALILNAANVFGTNAAADIHGALFAAIIVGMALNLCFPALILLFCFSRRFCERLIRFIVKVMRFFRLTKRPDALYKKIMSGLEENIRCIRAIAKRKRLIWCFLFAIAAHLAMSSVAYFSIKAFGGSASATGLEEWAYIVILSLFVVNSVAFIPTPGSSGAADMSFRWLFTACVTLSIGTGAFAMLTWRFFSFYMFIIVGFVQFTAIQINRRRKKRLGHATEDALETNAENEITTENEPVR